METESGKQSTFPKFLPKPDETVLKWVGEHLRSSRGRKSAAAVAKSAKVKIDEIENIEKGIIHQNLGQFRHIVRHGYGRKMEDVLLKCYVVFKEKFNPTGKRRFERDFYYSICLKDEGKKQPTPLLVGGDPENYLWAIPFRRLRRQPLSTDLLELAPARKKRHLGETTANSHAGVEVIHVIKGTVTVSFETDSEGSPERTLRNGDSIHFNSCHEHQIKNDGNTTPALLLIVRLPELP